MPGGQPTDLALGHLGDHLLVGAHPLAVKRRQHQLAAGAGAPRPPGAAATAGRAAGAGRCCAPARSCSRGRPRTGASATRGRRRRRRRRGRTGGRRRSRRARGASCSKNGIGRTRKRAVWTTRGSGTCGGPAPERGARPAAGRGRRLHLARPREALDRGQQLVRPSRRPRRRRVSTASRTQWLVWSASSFSETPSSALVTAATWVSTSTQ